MRNFQGIVFIWTQTYKKIFKSALVYLEERFTEIKSLNTKQYPARLSPPPVSTFLPKDSKIN